MSAAFDLTGRHALVTGSSRGVGYALATGLAQAGCRVALHGQDRTRVREAAARLADQTGAQVDAVSFDVTSPDQVRVGVAETLDVLGQIDILVNNAGIQRRHPVLQFPTAEWDQVLATNLTAPFLVAQRVAAGMVERGGGKIINIGSVQSGLARPTITPYAASKGGVVMLTKGLCAELGGSGVQVNTLAPGYIHTEMTQALVDDTSFNSWVVGRTPAARWGSVADLVGPLLFLASPASDFVNGQTLFVDGGMTAVV
ncbi:SDR family oxidoreductase [Xylanimonas ulmi]|uniref:Gluconate 5-dehydrogenase n=1 Tax=Xylanimonas ulmi TaxID=228973 RepID=A0A4Q7M791_9MICO|nr:SDR family oxidoreductase [Xylanibacterium ulmi]RZS62508.1 gluconate 5-dehydrogenase [Xylanibacterium ulmi]